MNPLKSEIEKNLTGLGEHFWKQIMDGWAHKWGPQIFDIGRHNGIAEPGFYESAKNAFLYSCEQIGTPLTIPLYQKIHAIACSHFQGEKNNTMVDNLEVGIFRQSKYSLSTLEPMFATSTDAKAKLQNIQSTRGILHKWFTLGNLEENASDLAIFDFYNDEIIPEYTVKLNLLNNAIEQESASLGLKDPLCIAASSAYSGQENFITLTYTLLDSQKLTETVQKIFNRFHFAIDQATGDEDKLRAICHLFQTLEWLHPFPDGQGRTDLLLLGKLLSEYGFHPTILEFPYVSSYVPLDEWVIYLKKGLLAWEKEKKQIAAPVSI